MGFIDYKLKTWNRIVYSGGIKKTIPTVTDAQIEQWFDVFNGLLFNSKLKCNFFTARHLYTYMGWCIVNDDDTEDVTFEIKIHNKLPLAELLGTIGHEMVHLYQYQIEKNFDMPEPEENGEAFFLFEEKFSKYGITIL